MDHETGKTSRRTRPHSIRFRSGMEDTNHVDHKSRRHILYQQHGYAVIEKRNFRELVRIPQKIPF
jgi:hypothetical protein